MSTALLLAGIALVAALQVSIHRRFAGLEALLHRALEKRASGQAEAMKARGDCMVEISGALSTTADRMRVCATDLQTLHADSAELLIQQRECTAELRVLAREAAAPMRVPDRRPPPVPRARRPLPALEVEEGRQRAKLPVQR